METKVEKLDDNKVKLIVTIDEKTISDKIKQQYKKTANQYTIPGFRKGKAPRPVIDNALGKDYIRAMVTDEVVNDAYPVAIDEADIFPVGQPDFDDESMDLVEDGKPYTFECTVDVKPTMELSSYDPVEIELPSGKVTDEQVDEEIDTMLDHYAELTNAPANTKVKAENAVELKMSATDDKGEPIESLTEDSMEYSLGSGLMPETFDEELLGLKKGDTKEFTIDMPKESYAMIMPLVGKTSSIHFDVEVLAVQKRTLPKLTDEWVKQKIGLDTVDDLRQEVREEIEEQLGQVIPRLKESRVLQQLQERLQGDVPDSVIEESETTLLQDFFNQLQRQGLTLDAYLKQAGLTSDGFKQDIRAQAQDVAAQDLALDAYAVHHKLEAKDDDIRKEFENAGVSDVDAMMDEWRSRGEMHLIKQGIIRQKAAQHLMDNAKVVEPKAEEKTTKKAADKKEDK